MGLNVNDRVQKEPVILTKKKLNALHYLHVFCIAC